MSPGRPRKQARRPLTRQDPAEIESRARSEHASIEWRDAFGAFVAGLSEERRAEIRARIAGLNPERARLREADRR